ncbi:putative glycerol 2-dehydrogenase (NADP) [Clavispora lusitaniae]|uniref:Glycerol 2-dehydrogenase (NADP) n=2 Tax=Clavispora lusitaniae TaxID=36911 RepID=A0ACD0WCH5_CLALS|nr:Aldo/keto reductase family protein [Clavispora lusitaniae]OVF08338.1 putative glycerol 2-dehydrogenase (NADP(+)) [Clavispora lusitaniae]QFZ25152.1 putative glycerol 2-dehydrogenase (NADP) [Clavispora lusitaniae]QFZ31545.1 putative glycerol 2-dehydrogenase (NADP) [Clavispora lusitaniae]QFZ37213.1 putative glycerol 2-dehydrogenase (NADP) [Clavispora lusitaniae]
MAAVKTNTDVFTLGNGNKIPAVALGTWESKGGDAYKSVKVALENGYRHIDTAAAYGNEKEVGQAIKDSGVPREEIFVTSKLWNDDHKNPSAAFEKSLKDLGLDYLDLYLMHWPVSNSDGRKSEEKDYDYIETYKKMQELAKSGKAKAIGISNFTKERIEKLLSDPEVTIKPAALQIEAHPLLTQPELFNYAKKENILIEAYSPLGHSSGDSPLFKNSLITSVAEKYGVDPAQVLISWAVQRGTVVLPKSVHEERIISNLKTFTLADEDFEALNNLSKKEGSQRVNDTPWDVFSNDP